MDPGSPYRGTGQAPARDDTSLRTILRHESRVRARDNTLSARNLYNSADAKIHHPHIQTNAGVYRFDRAL